MGKDEKSSELIEDSGINELRDFLIKKIEELRDFANVLREERIKIISDEAVEKLWLYYSSLNAIIDGKTKKIEENHFKDKKRALELQKDKTDFESEIGVLKRDIENLQKLIKELKSEHKKARAKY